MNRNEIVDSDQSVRNVPRKRASFMPEYQGKALLAAPSAMYGGTVQLSTQDAESCKCSDACHSGSMDLTALSMAFTRGIRTLAPHKSLGLKINHLASRRDDEIVHLK